MSVWSVARCAIRDHIKTIHDRRTKANTKIKTVDKKIVTGAVPAFALIDELPNDAHVYAPFGVALHDDRWAGADHWGSGRRAGAYARGALAPV